MRERAWAAASAVVDPELPALTIADLGVLRDIRVTDGAVEVAITPTYSGCPAMQVIALDIVTALERAGIAGARVRTVLSPAWTTAWRNRTRLPTLRRGGDRAIGGIRLDRLQGALALHRLPRAVRPLQMPLTPWPPRSRASIR